MVRILLMGTWLPIAKARFSSTRFLCLLKVAKVSNVDSIEIKDIMGDIAERLAKANILLYRLISFILNINAFG